MTRSKTEACLHSWTDLLVHYCQDKAGHNVAHSCPCGAVAK